MKELQKYILENDLKVKPQRLALLKLSRGNRKKYRFFKIKEVIT